MSENNIDETAPMNTQAIMPPVDPTEPIEIKTKPKRWIWILAGLAFVLVLGGLGAFIGYRVALEARMARQSDQVALLATTQFQLGLQDLEAKKFNTARQRFEYVIQLDPNFPGGKEKLAETMMQIAMVFTPTPAATPTIAVTPTPDLRGAEELFNTAQQYLREKNWAATFDTLEALRTEDATYRTIEVDGMYYIALRFRGIDKIIMDGNLEGGIYDLALTERFGPLDKEADGYRNWARLYLTGASFWGVDWQRVVEAFMQIYPSLPNLRDGSGYTASERFRIASINYGDQLAAAGDYCGARDQYLGALALAQDTNLAPTATAVQLVCSPLTATPAPTALVPTSLVPSETPASGITPIVVETPTATIDPAAATTTSP
jgi:tetratricopeptide (TPR) repeat protein